MAPQLGTLCSQRCVLLLICSYTVVTNKTGLSYASFGLRAWQHRDPRGTVDKADEQNPLLLASAGGHLDTVKYLVEECHCDPTVDKAGQTPLALAYSKRHLETVKYLVQEQQCNPNCMFFVVVVFQSIYYFLN